MANSLGTVTLGAIRTLAQQESDMLNSNFVTTTEWNSFINNSYKELYDLLVSAYGNEYYVATPYQFTTDGTNKLFNLPTDFYKSLGVDLQIGNSQNSFVSLKPYNFPERNKYSVPNIQAFYGYTNLKYKIVGSQIMFNMIPVGGQLIQIWYVPEPSNLQRSFIGSTTNGSAVVGVGDTSNLSINMIVSQASNSGSPIPAQTNILSKITDTSITLNANAVASGNGQTLFGWFESTTLDGISGWEEYIVIDAAMKAMAKEESDIQPLLVRKQAMLKRLEDMAEARDAGEPMTVSDSRNNNLVWGEWGTGWDGSAFY